MPNILDDIQHFIKTGDWAGNLDLPYAEQELYALANTGVILFWPSLPLIQYQNYLVGLDRNAESRSYFFRWIKMGENKDKHVIKTPLPFDKV